MTRAQQYIHSLMENVAEGQISSDNYRLTFAKVRRRLAEAQDFDGEMRHVYRVVGFSNFALALMWIAERVEADPSKLEYTPEEQSLIVSHFRFAIGDMGSPPLGGAQIASDSEAGNEASAFTPIGEIQEATPAVEEIPEMPAHSEANNEASVFTPIGEIQEATPAVEETPEMPAQLQMETAGRIDESEKTVYAPPPEPASGLEGEFAALMEKFVEAMQSGSDERDGLVQSVLAQSNTMMAEGSGVPDDLREFSGFLLEFLRYITENGFMDDVRVMNILSNVSGPVASWAQAPPDGRGGILTEGTEILRTFKSLFE